MRFRGLSVSGVLLCVSCASPMGDGGPAGSLPPEGPSSSPPEDPSGTHGCGLTTRVELRVDVVPAEMLLVVDRSGSMRDPIDHLSPTGPSKWRAMQEGLTSATLATDQLMDYGLMFFPEDNECGPGHVSVTVMPRRAGAVAGALMNQNPMWGGATPTAPTLRAALDYFRAAPTTSAGRYVLLATDGTPNCGESLEMETLPATLSALRELSDEGIPTYVVGFRGSSLSDPTVLEQMAEAGSTDTYLTAASVGELEGIVRDLVTRITPPSCTYKLEGDAPDPALLRVDLDGERIPRDQGWVNGWDYTESTHSITFYGEPCNRLQSGAVSDVRMICTSNPF